MTFDPAILHALLTAAAPLSLDELAARAGRSTDDVSSQLDQLRDAGCTIDDRDRAGVRLRQTGLGVWVDYVQWACPWRGRRRAVELYRQTASTQDAVRAMIGRRGAEADGAIAVADEQTAGRGRLGRRWLAPPGACVLFSRAVVQSRDDEGAANRNAKDAREAADASPHAAPPADQLTLAAAVGVARAMAAIGAPRALAVGIKWPNDIVVAGRKLAGILVEADPATRSAVIGIGVNVKLQPDDLPDEGDLRQRTTSLAMCGLDIDRLAVLAQTLSHIDACLAERDIDKLIDEWRSRSVLLSQWTTFAHNGRTVRGQVHDLDARAGLIIRTDAGQLIHLPAATTSVVPD